MVDDGLRFETLEGNVGGIWQPVFDITKHDATAERENAALQPVAKSANLDLILYEVCRREFRRLVLEVLREQCATDEEFDAESQALTGSR